MTITLTGTVALSSQSFPIVNVKDYGAVGDGIHDDTANIQAAFTAAFGAWNGTPNGNSNKSKNIPVYFPGGTYLTTSPLYLVEVYGGTIFGEGANATTISFVPGALGNAIIPNPSAVITASITTNTTLNVTVINSTSVGPNPLAIGAVISGAGVTANTTITGLGSGTGGTGSYTITSSSNVGSESMNVASPGYEITPCIMTNGYGLVTFSGISIGLAGGLTPNATNNYTGFYYYSNPATQSNGSTSTACRWTDVNIGGFWIGMIVGYGIGSGSNQENCILTSVVFNLCLRYGLRLLNQNVLNWQSYGGGAASCGTSDGSGTGVITGTQAAGYSIQGASITIVSPSMSGNGWDFIISNPSAPFVLTGGSTEGSVTGGQSCLALDGASGYVSGFCFRSGGFTGYVFVDLSVSGLVVLDGCMFAPGTSSAGNMINFGGNGVALVDNPYYGSTASGMGFAGTSNALLYYRGSAPLNSTAFSGFSGRVAEYNPWTGVGSATPKVADLPTPSAIWKGVRMVVTDSTVAAATGAISNCGQVVAGTGSNTVPVFCDGTNWLIG